MLSDSIDDRGDALAINGTLPCRICRSPRGNGPSVVVKGATLDVQHESFTVWRCSGCGTLNAAEAVDFDRIYRNYPIQRQRYDGFAKLMFAKRLRILRRTGLRPGQRVLDYGCGSGHFVRYLQERGWRCWGYDPYNPEHADRALLRGTFDLVTCQDVIEHVDEPAALLATLTGLVSEGGRLVVGTPYAENVALDDRIDQLGVLHQPFHRFVMAKAEAPRFFSPPGWRLVELLDACYIDTPIPFANTMFLFHLFDSADGMMDFAFGDIPARHFIRHPELIFWGLFGSLFARKQDLFAVMQRT